LKYWVDFDEPQYDADGAGPFRKAQVWGDTYSPSATSELVVR
jgi:hypothetical protein